MPTRLTEFSGVAPMTLWKLWLHQTDPGGKECAAAGGGRHAHRPMQAAAMHAGTLPPNPHQRVLPFGNHDFIKQIRGVRNARLPGAGGTRIAQCRLPQCMRGRCPRTPTKGYYPLETMTSSNRSGGGKECAAAGRRAARASPNAGCRNACGGVAPEPPPKGITLWKP